jgi:hypothetical protein
MCDICVHYGQTFTQFHLSATNYNKSCPGLNKLHFTTNLIITITMHLTQATAPAMEC